MLSIYNISSIAKYERKALFRSWFFRISGILSLIVLFFMNLGLISDGGRPLWVFRAIPSTIPYFNLLMLNTVQAVIAVFLASDFLKRDKKLDTTEVIYMRPLTNGEYVIGKTLGNIQVFMALNIVALVMALAFNLITTGVDVNWPSYIIYLAIISIPTLIFIMGLSFFVMSILKNQAVTMIIILGYISITLFLLRADYYYIFDYMAFNIPLLQSGIAGFGNLEVILIHRGIYLSLGIGFILMSIYLLKRLPQSESMTALSLVFGILFIVFGIYLGYNHIERFRGEGRLREKVIALNNQYAGNNFADVASQKIQLKHKGKEIEVATQMLLKNHSGAPLPEIIMHLNPGLNISSAEIDGSKVGFERIEHLVIINCEKPLIPGDSMNINMKYSGSINEAVCYLDIDKETRNKKFGIFVLSTDKRFAFIQPDYVLLTREANWYPSPGISYSSEKAGWHREGFIHFNLEVETNQSLTAVSQGKITHNEPGKFTFTPEYPLTQLSLAIGDYEQKYFDNDSIRFSVWYIKGHDFFSGSLPDIADSIPEIITARFDDFQRKYDLRYSFNRLSIVETPAQFKSFERIWTSAQEYIQPEQVLLQEKGYLLKESDFGTRIKREKKRAKQRKESLSEEEYQERALNSFLSNFTRDEGRPSFRMVMGGSFEAEENANPYFIFPELYNFQNNIRSDTWPVINRIFEAYLKSQGTTSMRSAFIRNMSGGNEDEEANMALQSKTFAELLADTEQRKIIDNIIKLKGDVLFNLIQTKAGEAKFKLFLKRLLERSKFKTISFDEFDKMVNEEFGIELTPFMDTWFKKTGLPKYLISPISAVKVKSGGQMKTMVSFKASNMSDYEGIIKLVFRVGNGPGRMRRGFGGTPNPNNQINKILYLDAHQTKEVSYLLNSEPRMLSINTLTSRNIPQLIIHRFTKIEEDGKVKPVEQEVVSEKPVSLLEPNEIILDNEDPGFEVTGNTTSSLLQKWLLKDNETEGKYSGFVPWRPPSKWTNTTNSGYYGKYIRSAYYIKSGEGNQKATWNVPVKEASYYDVYYYVYKERSFRRHGGGKEGEYTFTIYHDDGVEQQTLEINNAESGWNLIGSYYFSPGIAKIELSDKSKLRVVFADAVKLVKL
ncbi:FIG00898757: hypothetical protein [hydrothermal vent metagenome]|uniref:Golvesin/Xly CBD-like domain-containing protein n=1 Tax=hydrothermal vent metagenome TaxID=652676 RepID=A0A3B0U107_9ZZZZ